MISTTAPGRLGRDAERKTAGMLGASTETVRQYILERIEPEPNSGCWLWSRGLSQGYATAKIRGKQRKVHRVAFDVFVGAIGKHHVLHSCDNPSCVNPDHLRLGDHKENMRDRAKRRRTAQRKLSTDDVNTIRQRRCAGESLKSIANDFCVSSTTIMNTTSGKFYRYG
jgi:hypothetical protein